jgi:hypothetical protein
MNWLFTKKAAVNTTNLPAQQQNSAVTSSVLKTPISTRTPMGATKEIVNFQHVISKFIKSYVTDDERVRHSFELTDKIAKTFEGTNQKYVIDCQFDIYGYGELLSKILHHEIMCDKYTEPAANGINCLI